MNKLETALFKIKWYFRPLRQKKMLKKLSEVEREILNATHSIVQKRADIETLSFKRMLIKKDLNSNFDLKEIPNETVEQAIKYAAIL